MKKEDLRVFLKSGMMVETNFPRRYLVVECNGELLLMSSTGFNRVNDYDDNLYSQSGAFDIMEIYSCPMNLNKFMNTDKEGRTLLWRRAVPKKMTISEIENELGYEIEVVK